MDYKDDLNCSLIAAEDHGPMTLDEVSKRIGLTLVRVKQIEEKAMDKLKKRILPILHE
jgi:DNA-directed RNA polymerase sigma subunit (sigma70/sigma32)